jgi:uncharacterized protein YukE
MFFNTDCYKDGYESGKADALSGKDRNYLKFRAKFLIYGNSSINTFQEGYDAGYTDGLRLKNLQNSKLSIENENFTEQEIKEAKQQSSIFNSDCYKDGYETGRAEALAGKDRDNRKIRLKFLIYGSNSIETFDNGYSQGYTDGLREKALKEYAEKNQTVSKQSEQKSSNFSQSNKTTNMSNGRISVSREAVMNLITTLGKYKSDLEIVRQNLEWGLSQLEQEWNDDDFQRYREEALKIAQQIDYVSQAMLENDLIPRTMDYYQKIYDIKF